MIGDPPSDAGGVKLIVAWPLPGVALPMVGASGALGAAGPVPRMNAPKAPESVPTVTVATTVLVAESMTDTLPLL